MKKLTLLEISTTEAQGDKYADKAEWIVSTAVAENAAAVRIIHTAGPMLALRDFAAQKLEAAGISVL
jgi:hypothetical protein